MWTAARGRFGLLYSFFCCFVALSPCFVAHGWRTLPMLGIWLSGAGARWYFDDRQVVTDTIVFGILIAIAVKEGLSDVVLKTWEELDVPVSARPWNLMTCVAILLALNTLRSRYRAYCKGSTSKVLPDDVSPWTVPYPKARIFPSQIKHVRMFPKRHSFEYSYLQCGFPIIPGGVFADGTEIGCGHDLRLGNWWLRIRAEDYLSRGNMALGFYGRLRLFLREQVCDPERAPPYRTIIIVQVLRLAACRRCRMVICLPRHCTSLSGLRFQPCIVLVHLRLRKSASKDDCRG
jgi:hypothetical protein